MRRTRHPVVAILGWASFATGAATGQSVERVSVATDGTPGNDLSRHPSVSNDGSLVVFSSRATNLIVGDTNRAEDIFLRDRAAGTTRRISVNSSGVAADGECRAPQISGDGKFVVYSSDADNLVSSDKNGFYDIFIYEIATGTTSRLSVSSSNVEANGDCTNPAISQDGRYVAFLSFATNLVAGDTNRTQDVFVRDRQAGTTIRVSVSSSGVQANEDCYEPVISGDGRFVAYSTYATNLDPRDTDEYGDVYVRDTLLGTTALASISTSGAKGDGDSYAPALSGDGRYVEFLSYAGNLFNGDLSYSVDAIVRDSLTGVTGCVSLDSDGAHPGASIMVETAISQDGRFRFFDSDSPFLVGSDTNGETDLFCRDESLAMTTQQDVTADGNEADLAAR